MSVTYDGNDRPIKFSKLIYQHQLVPFERLQRLLHAICVTKVFENQDIPDSPCVSQELGSANVLADTVVFYNRVHSDVVAELLEYIIASTGVSKVIQGKKNQMTLTYPSTEKWKDI